MNSLFKRLTVLDEDKIGFDFIGEYRIPLKTLIQNEVNNYNVFLEDKQEVNELNDFVKKLIRNCEVLELKKLFCIKNLIKETILDVSHTLRIYDIFVKLIKLKKSMFD